MGELYELYSRLNISELHIGINDILDIVLVATLVYIVISWIQDTRAWTLFKGILFLLGFTLFAYFFKLNTVLWIFENTISVGIIAVIILFQPELRRALDELGRGNFLKSLFNFNDDEEERYKIQKHVYQEIIGAVTELAKTKTGALIALERDTKLTEWDRTGITLDSVVSSQLLINIFEHNTPLHDGAVIIRENRISAGTCYLPLTESLSLSKELGTRHRAALGLSEVTDALVVVVSEETGTISLAKEGNLTRNLSPDALRKLLKVTQQKASSKKKFVLWKGRK